MLLQLQLSSRIVSESLVFLLFQDLELFKDRNQKDVQSLHEIRCEFLLTLLKFVAFLVHQLEYLCRYRF